MRVPRKTTYIRVLKMTRSNGVGLVMRSILLVEVIQSLEPRIYSEEQPKRDISATNKSIIMKQMFDFALILVLAVAVAKKLYRTAQAL